MKLVAEKDLMVEVKIKKIEIVSYNTKKDSLLNHRQGWLSFTLTCVKVLGKSDIVFQIVSCSHIIQTVQQAAAGHYHWCIIVILLEY